MNDRLPYEEQINQQWNDLSLPDENMAWEDMKRRLEEDDDDGIIPFWLRGCGLWSLLSVILLGLGWWLLRPEKWWNKKRATENVSIIESKKEKQGATTMDSSQTNHQMIGTNKEYSLDSVNDHVASSRSRADKKRLLSREKSNIAVSVANPGSKKMRSNNVRSFNRSNGNRNNKRPAARKQLSQIKKEKADIAVEPGKTVRNNPGDSTGDQVVRDKTGEDFVNIIPGISPAKDSLHNKLTDSSGKNENASAVKTNAQKKDSSKTKAIFFSVGIALHQQLPVEGQKLVPYSAEGRKGSLADYIPSLWFRMYKNNKWFVQAEFRYGAPQYTKEFLFQKSVVRDSLGPFNDHTNTTSLRLKKTFYHQLPVTFNYFVLPNWSVGAGVIWNRFSGAISEQDITSHNNATQVDSIIVKGKIVKYNNDTLSIFKKSYFQAVFETQYRWRRFSAGARYSFGLQPYITFTLPGAAQQEERNRSLQVFLRYELWKSKAKSAKR